MVQAVPWSTYTYTDIPCSHMKGTPAAEETVRDIATIGVIPQDMQSKWSNATYIQRSQVMDGDLQINQFLWFICKQQSQKHFREITILTCGNTPSARSHLEWLAPSQPFNLATLDFLIGIWLGNFLPDDLWFEAFCFLPRVLQCPNQQSGPLETCSPIHTEYITPNDNTLLPAHNPQTQNTHPKID